MPILTDLDNKVKKHICPRIYFKNRASSNNEFCMEVNFHQNISKGCFECSVLFIKQKNQSLCNQ